MSPSRSHLIASPSLRERYCHCCCCCCCSWTISYLVLPHSLLVLCLELLPILRTSNMNSDDNDNASASISNMLDELDATENENNDPFVMLDSMEEGQIISSHMHTTIPVRGRASPRALARLAYAQTEFHNTRVRFHAVVPAPKPGTKHYMPLLGTQTHLTNVCWSVFHKYVKLHAGWKLRRRSCGEENQEGFAKKRVSYCIDAVYMAPKALVAVTVATATATAIATMDGALVDSTNVATSIKTVEHKPPAQTMPTMATSAPPDDVAAVSVATTALASVNATQSPTPAAVDGTITTTGHVFRYGDLVAFPTDHLTTSTTLKAIVVQVHPVSEHDNYSKSENKDKDKDEDMQQVTVSTGPGERFTLPIHQLVLIQPLLVKPS